MADKAKGYPGELASPQQVYELAEEYRKAAHLALQLGRPRKPLMCAPFRLLAIHAVELYMSALLLQRGQAADRVCGMQHDLLARAELALAEGLLLRARTKEHLGSLSFNREYVVTRYEPELLTTASQINRLTATLDEVAEKVTVLISQPLRKPSISKRATADSVSGPGTQEGTAANPAA